MVCSVPGGSLTCTSSSSLPSPNQVFFVATFTGSGLSGGTVTVKPSWRGGELLRHALRRSRRPQEADHPQGSPQHDAHGDLVAEHAPPVASIDLPQRQRPRDERGGLRPGVAARR